MLNRFMITAATVALIAGAGFANAQGTGSSPGSAGGSAVQSQAPTGSSAAPAAAEPNKPSGMKATQSEDKLQGSKNQRAQDDMKAGTKGEKSAQDNMKGEMKGERSKSTSSETDNAKGAKDMKAEDRNTKMNSAQSKDGMSKDGMNNAQSKSPTESRTTGNAATSATAAPPAEKQTQISSAIRQERVEEVTNVNFDISVGARIPTSVRFHTLPSRIVEIYPEWRGYEFILVHGRYIIVRPQTHEIVYIIEG
jgi:hypothetical protein